jgi:hypothetical protein
MDSDSSALALAEKETTGLVCLRVQKGIGGEVKPMSWKQKTVARILLLVARMINEDNWLAEELKSLSSHISAGIGL